MTTGAMTGAFQVKRHGRYQFCEQLNRMLFKVEGYTIFQQTETEQVFGTRPGCRKWQNVANAAAAAERASRGITEGIEIRVGRIPYDE